MSNDFQNRMKNPDATPNSELIKMMNVDYQIIVRKNRKGFFLIVPKLNLIAKGDDIQSAYQNLENEKRNLFKKYIEIGAKDQMPLPLKHSPILFFTKMAIIVLSIVILMNLAVVGAKYTYMLARRQVEKELRYFGGNIKNKITIDAVKNLAQRLQDTSPESRQELLANLRIIVNELKPFIDELRPLFPKDAEGRN